MKRAGEAPNISAIARQFKVKRAFVTKWVDWYQSTGGVSDGAVGRPSGLGTQKLGTTRAASLHSQDLDGLATLLNSRKSVKVAFLTGAGISVAAGIPDFRSPGGMYDTLRPDLLTAQDRDRERMMDDPTAVVSKDLFFRNPFPYLELRRPFILGTGDRKWKMTIAHAFQRLCYDKDLLHRVYTQNIDGLDFQANIPRDIVINVHGTMGSVSCEHCKKAYPIEQFRDDVRRNIKDIYNTDPQAPLESSLILCPQCGQP
ncbi:hypothetical protein CYMTET_29875, partial [Cymbomonas tetramitiformis]